MKRKISQLAIMAFLLSSLAFADDKNKSSSTSDNAQPAATSADNASGNQTPCVSDADKKAGDKKKKDKNKAKLAPTDQEEQFNQVLMGIYG